MEINLTDGKCIIDIKNWCEDVTFTSSDPTLLALLSFIQRESINIDLIESTSSEELCIAVYTLSYDQILLIEQILGNINISIVEDMQCIPYLGIKVNCDYIEERFGYYE